MFLRTAKRDPDLTPLRGGGADIALAPSFVSDRRRPRAVASALSWIRAGLLASILAAAGAVGAQTSDRPLTLVVPFPPGGSTDFVVRTLQPKLAERMGRTVIVENRAGAASQIATQHVALAAPDGNTLLVAIDNHALNPIVKPKLPYDSFRDFAAVGLLVRFPFVLWAHPSVPGSDLKEFIERSRQEAPGRYSFASTGVGSLNHLVPEHVQRLAGVEWLHVPFAGGGAAVHAVVSNTTPMAFLSYALMRPQLLAGTVKPLAVTGSNRLPDLPNVATVAEMGYPGFEAHSWTGLLAPAGTPDAILRKLSADFQAVLADPQVRTALASAGFEVMGTGPEAFERHLRSEHDRWKKFVSESGLRLQP